MSCFLLMFLWLLGAAILGFLLAWLLRNSRIKTITEEKNHQYGLYQSLDGKYQTSIKQNSTLEHDKIRLKAEQGTLNGQISDLQAQFSSKEQELTNANSKYANLESRFGELNTTYGHLKSSLDTKVIAFGQLETNYNKVKTELDQVKGSIAEQEANAKEANQRANTLKGDFDRMFAEKQRISTQFEYFKSQEEGKEAEWQKANENWNTERNQLSTRIETLENQIQVLGAEKATLGEEWATKYAQSEQEKNALATEIENKAEQRGVWETRYNRVFSSQQQLLRDIEPLKEQNGTLAEEKQSLSAEIDALKAKLDAAKSDNSKTVELEQQLQNNASKLAALEAEKNQLATQLTDLRAKEASLLQYKATASQEMEALKPRISQLSSSRDTALEQLEQLKASVARLEQSNATLAEEKAKLEQSTAQLNTQGEAITEQLKQENANLLAELSAFRMAAEKRKSGSADNERKRQEVLARIAKRKGKVDFDRIGTGNKEDKDNLKRLRGLGGFVEQKFNALGIYKFSQLANFMKGDKVNMNEWLELPKNKIQKEDWVLECRKILGLEVDTDPTATLARVQSRQKSINFGRIGTASAANKDDLQRINDISAFDEAKLNALGIYRFSQIAALSPKDTTAVNEAIEVFEGRINRETWVPQAKQLEASSMEEILARVSERASNINFNRIGQSSASNKDNLQAINGIGPFIEAKLNAVGIYRFEQVAKFDKEDEVTVNEVIELNAGHIQSDEWVRQAQAMKGKK